MIYPTKNREDYNRSKYSRGAVYEAAHDSVPEAVVVHRVVRGEGYQTSERQAH